MTSERLFNDIPLLRASGFDDAADEIERLRGLIDELRETTAHYSSTASAADWQRLAAAIDSLVTGHSANDAQA